jgi:hypothetical protein
MSQQSYEQRRDRRFYEATIATLKDIEERALQLPQDQRYAAAYGILRGYVENLLVNFAESFNVDQLAEIRIVLDQLAKVTGEDQYLDEATRTRLDQLAQSLRESEQASYTLYWHPDPMYTARLAYGNDTPLWSSERLEVWHEGKWIPGKVGYLMASGGLVLWPREKNGNPQYITLTVGSMVRNVSEPRGDGGGPEQ